MQERLPSGSVTQQILEQSPNYGGKAGLSGYATLTQPTMLDIPSEWIRISVNDVCELNPKVKLNDDLDVAFMQCRLFPKNFMENQNMK